MGAVYKITNKINGKIYIGRTTRTIKERFAEHCRPSHGMSGIDKAINKYGRENFTYEQLAVSDKENVLDELEIYFIKLYDAKNDKIGYNLCDGGKTSKGYHHRPESCEKMTRSRTGLFSGEKNPFYGKTHTDESKKKMSITKTGIPLSEDHKQHLSETSPMKRKVVCVTTGEIFNSLTEASKKYDIPVTHISRVCRGKRKSCKGLKFIYDNTVPSLNENEEGVTTIPKGSSADI